METPGSAQSARAVPDVPAPDSGSPAMSGLVMPSTDAAGTDAPQPGSGPARDTGPVWRFLITPRWVGWHLFAVLAFWGMCWLGDWQLHRALGGNALSWAYTFEWPLFAVFGAVFWARTIRDEFRLRRGIAAPEAVRARAVSATVLPDGIGIRQIEEPGGEADDAELASYNAYIAKLSAEVKGHNKWLGSR